MKAKKVLKSLADLPVELIEAEAAGDEERKLQPAQPTAPPQSSIPTAGVTRLSAPTACRGWGINE